MSSDATQLRFPAESRRLVEQLQARAGRAVMLNLPVTEPREYLYDLLTEYPLRPGKGLRPVLCMAACAAFGGSYDEALPLAAALEMLHNAFLVHDDIQDGSASRRGRPSLHVQHGTPIALNVGDALAARASAEFVRAARRFSPPVATALLEGWERLNQETIEGQALDVGWQRDNVIDLSVSDYLVMCGKKTAWYTTIQPLMIGATVGSGRAVREPELFRFGWLLGVLFQIVNDLGGLRSGEDIEEGKRTLLVIHMLGAVNGRDRARAARILGLPRERRGEKEIAWMLERMEQAGSIDYARTCVGELAAAAARQAELVFGQLPDGEARGLLISTPAYVLAESRV